MKAIAAPEPPPAEFVKITEIWSVDKQGCMVKRLFSVMPTGYVLIEPGVTESELTNAIATSKRLDP